MNCNLEMWAPDNRNHAVNTAFTLYAMEQEGDLFTREGKINKVISYLVEAEDPNDFATQCEAYDAANIDSDTFTDEEVEFIAHAISQRRRYR